MPSGAWGTGAWGTGAWGGAASEEAPICETVPPVISDILPADQILRPNTVAGFDVTDDSGSVFVSVLASYPDGSQDVVFDGFEFGKKFTQSSRASIVNGWRFSVRLNGGWVDPPTFKIVAVDGSGNFAS